jgi:hypothetical protein
MPFVVKDRVQVTSTTTGTGTFTLGAATTGFQSFASIGSTSGWNIATAQPFQSFSVAAEETLPQGVFFKPDGFKMYVVGATGDDVNEYNLSVAWDVRTSVYLQNFSVAAQEAAPRGLFFKPDGLKMYITGSTTSDAVLEYNLASAWDISTASYLQSFSVSAQETFPTDLFFRSDGLKLYVVGLTNDYVNEYDLSSAWNVSTASYLQRFLLGDALNVGGVFFKTDGTKMYILGNGTDVVNEYNLSSAWNVTTASLFQSLSIAAQSVGSGSGLYFKSDGGQMYLSGVPTTSVYQYTLSVNNTYYAIANNTDWEVGIGTVTTDGNVLYRNTVLESSNSNALVNWGAGSKNVFCTFPSDATEGTVPTADNSSVGTDLYAWTNLKKQLDAGVINGVPYNNNNTAGMVSTYSLIRTGTSQYRGGVLALNGDIHFVPYLTAVGQKISATGVVSTYSLIYTDSGGAYSGGVLAPNGDIHFVPQDAPRGQKINASGVVSTYSLVYTAANAYQGGVLDPAGSVHFVPWAANRGQKISSSGVVSTYSLIYTGVNPYAGGVLAPNGDIHFVPYGAPVGQKVSAAGVVSTYSLVYTSSAAYQGGVLGANGDIYFVPYSAAVGQKVSITGVVSTYSLAYTIGAAYSGGVLAPNGDIHFVPYGNANRGQKISASGVVSTYSLIYSTDLADKYWGGVLDTNGNIQFIPYDAPVGQRISTNTRMPIGYALSPFFNKF